MLRRIGTFDWIADRGCDDKGKEAFVLYIKRYWKEYLGDDPSNTMSLYTRKCKYDLGFLWMFFDELTDEITGTESECIKEAELVLKSLKKSQKAFVWRTGTLEEHKLAFMNARRRLFMFERTGE